MKMMISQPDASGHFGPYGGRFVPEVLMAPLEELEQAHAVRGLIVPRTAVRRPIDEWTDGLLPIETLVDVVAFKVVAAGKTEELRMHRGHFSH